jgi:hypothetical protein
MPYVSIEFLEGEPADELAAALHNPLVSGAGVACRWGRVVLLSRGTKQFRKNRFQGIRPYLITGNRGMQLVSIHHAVQQLAI